MKKLLYPFINLSIFLSLMFVISCEEEQEPEDCAGIPGGESVCGCMDTLATNYNSLATFDNDSCEYDTDSTSISGCMDTLAINYDSLATVDDGTCEYDTVSSEDIALAILFAEQANDEIEDVFSALYEADDPNIDYYDFGTAHDLYNQALGYDPDNLDANFGIAFTGLMQILQDPSFDEMTGNWNDYFEETDLWSVDETSGQLFGTNGFGIPLNKSKMKIPFEPILNFPIRLGQMTLDYVPQFSELQNIVRTVVLPYVNAGIDGLAKVEENPDYTFTISGRMQPDVGSAPLEMDMTEIYMIDMMLHAIKAISNMILGHKFDFVTHDAAGIVTELNRGSAFATLGSTGASELETAHQSLQTAISKLESSINFLENESDDQDNDIILQMDGSSDYQDVRDAISEANDVITQPVWVSYYRYNEIYIEELDYWFEEEIEDSTQINISKFFTNPLTDLKELFPPYQVVAGTEYDWDIDWDAIADYHDEDNYDSVEFVIDTSMFEVNYWGSFYFDYEIEYYPNGDTEIYDYASDDNFEFPNSIINTLNNKLDSLKTVYSNNMIRVYVYWSCYGEGCESENLVEVQKRVIRWRVYDVEFEGAYSYPIITWDADTYEDWKAGFSNPTVNDIFPLWTIDDLFEFIGIDDEEMADEWEKVWD